MCRLGVCERVCACAYVRVREHAQGVHMCDIGTKKGERPRHLQGPFAANHDPYRHTRTHMTLFSNKTLFTPICFLSPFPDQKTPTPVHNTNCNKRHSFPYLGGCALKVLAFEREAPYCCLQKGLILIFPAAQRIVTNVFPTPRPCKCFRVPGSAHRR